MGAQRARRAREPRGHRLPAGDEHRRAPRHPGVLTVAEESTAWDGVSRPVDAGGLGFSAQVEHGLDARHARVLRTEPVHRAGTTTSSRSGCSTPGARTSCCRSAHDEVVHLKGSLLGKMPGDRWQQLANLRALYAWMWAHPGKQLLFMGGELAQEREWSHDREPRLAPARRSRAPGRPRPGARAEPGRGARARRCGRPTTARRLPLARRRRRRPRRCYSFLRAAVGGTGGWWLWSPTSRRCRATATGSACPRVGRGSTCSTPTTSGGAAAASCSPSVDGRRRAVAGPARLRGAHPPAAGGALARPRPTDLEPLPRPPPR